MPLTEHDVLKLRKIALVLLMWGATLNLEAKDDAQILRDIADRIEQTLTLPLGSRLKVG